MPDDKSAKYPEQKIKPYRPAVVNAEKQNYVKQGDHTIDHIFNKYEKRVVLYGDSDYSENVE